MLNGENLSCTPSKMLRSSMENCYIPATWCCMARPILHTWKSSWKSSMIIHSCHAIHLKEPTQICTGGSKYFVSQWRDQFRSRAHTQTLEPSLMRVPKLASEFSLEKGGELGSSSQNRKARAGTSDGQKPLGSTSWSCVLHSQSIRSAVSKSLAITEGLWKAGGWVEAVTDRSMKSSSLSMTHANNLISQWAPGMSQACITLQMDPQEGSTLHKTFCFWPYLSLRCSQNTSTMSVFPLAPASQTTGESKRRLLSEALKGSSHHANIRMKLSNVKPTSGLHTWKHGEVHSMHGSLGSTEPGSKRRKPMPNPADLTPAWFPLHPHITAKERLQL